MGIRKIVLCACLLLPCSVLAESTTGGLALQFESGSMHNHVDSHAGNNGAGIRVGTIRDSRTQYRVSVEKVRIGDINNMIDQAKRSRAKIAIGTTNQSALSSIKSDIHSRNIQNSIRAGTDNHAVVSVGDITNAEINGRIEFMVNVRRDVYNSIKGGRNNAAEVHIGRMGQESRSQAFSPSDHGQTAARIHRLQQGLSPKYASMAFHPKSAGRGAPMVTQKQAPDTEKYSIEKRQSSIFGMGGHNFLVLRDAKGKIIAEFHGLATDKYGKQTKNLGDHLTFVEFHKPSKYIAKGQATAVLIRGSKEEILQRWSVGRKVGEYINTLHLSYPKFGFKPFGKTINSNSVESTLSYAMDIKSHKMTWPLSIQDEAFAIEYDIKPEPDSLLTPGEGRIIKKNVIDQFRYIPVANK